MLLESAAFGDGQVIPRRQTCEGEDLSPSLHWSGAPAETQSFAIFCEDPDAPSGTWRHWAAYDIPAQRSELHEGVSSRATDFKQAINDFRRRGYGGPCPPPGHGPHHYRFTLIALDVRSLGLRDGAPYRDVERAARGHALAQARLTGTYER